jgi:hypothetical protein
MLTALAAEIQRSPPEGARFTLDGSERLEKHLGAVCHEVLEQLQSIIPPERLQAIALGGGYGRGEGGVLRAETGDQPYNDLEFYVFVAGHAWLNERRYGTALHRLSENLSAPAGVEVEFKITSLAELRRSSPSMFYHDLVMGHRWLLGDDGLLNGCEHHSHAALLPASEATRLLLNRCSGLLLARDRLQRERFTGSDADFVFRNLAKVQLALGDALLTTEGRYHWSCQERHRRLQRLLPAKDFIWMEVVRAHHATGVDFKLHPHRPALPREALQAMHDELSSLALRVWLWLESRRLQCRFATAQEYGLSSVNKWPGTPLWRNWMANVKVFGPAALAQPRSWRHPRDRVLSALAFLLWADTDAGSPRTVTRFLGASKAGPLITCYQKRWLGVC